MTTLLSLLLSALALAHVPALLLPIEGTPIATYHLTHGEVSRAVYSELTRPGDLFVVSWMQPAGEPALVQLYTPKCSRIPEYERFQPRALLIRGEVPWKTPGESTPRYLKRLRGLSVAQLESRYRAGERPVFEEARTKQSLWTGAEWRGRLDAGFYSLVIYDTDGRSGNFVLGLNEKESWNPDLWRYVGGIVPRINKGLCDPAGFSGQLRR